MIASVTGPVLAIRPEGVVVDVGGVGLSVLTTPATRLALRPGDRVSLATSLVVREESLTLYGFAEEDERDLFELLQTSSGIGPRIAQAVLTVHPPDAVRRAVATEDVAALTRVPGIGRKGAQRLVLELKDKLALAGAGQEPVAGPAAGSWQQTLTDALTGLGWSASEADSALRQLAEQHPDAGPADVPDLLREALALLGRVR